MIEMAVPGARSIIRYRQRLMAMIVPLRALGVYQ